MRENAALARWRDGEQTIGCWLSLPCTHSAESLASLPFDWVCLDMQHGLLDYSDLTRMLPAVSNGRITPLVRVPWNEPAQIMKALDAGAYGVIVPMINDRAEAERAVAACRYPPDGMRSFGPIRAALYGGQGYAAEANGQIACIGMVETRRGLDNLDEIAATPGLDAIYIGPSDLSLALGLPPTGDSDHPGHAAAVARILAACRKAGIAAGMHAASSNFAARYLDAGFNLVNLGTDARFMLRMAEAELAAVRGAQRPGREESGY